MVVARWTPRSSAHVIAIDVDSQMSFRAAALAALLAATPAAARAADCTMWFRGKAIDCYQVKPEMVEAAGAGKVNFRLSLKHADPGLVKEIVSKLSAGRR